MSNIEHLIENAITTIEENQTFKDFIGYNYNKMMLETVSASAEEIWEMALYVHYVYKSGIILDMVDKYGYVIDE